jgi:hypothetical protein
MKRTDNIGSLSRNKKKEKSTHPDHRGQCVIEGRPFWISAWVNEDPNSGDKYFKLYFTPKEQNELAVEDNPPPAAPAPEPLADQPDIPF